MDSNRPRWNIYAHYDPDAPIRPLPGTKKEYHVTRKSGFELQWFPDRPPLPGFRTPQVRRIDARDTRGDPSEDQDTNDDQDTSNDQDTSDDYTSEDVFCELCILIKKQQSWCNADSQLRIGP